MSDCPYSSQFRSEPMDRRSFLKTAVTSASVAIASTLHAAEPPRPKGSLPMRPFKGSFNLSIIGFPGLCLNRVDQENANRIVARAYDEGINYFDVAPAYGSAEEKLGPALEPYRKNVFLACKTKARDADGTRAEMKRSMERLRTDHFELYQLHVLKFTDKDVDAAFMKGGAMEAIEEAKKDGRIRYVGFSAHTIEAAEAALNRYPFDSMMLPINYASFYKGKFGPTAVKLAQEKGTRIISIKAFVKQEWPSDWAKDPVLSDIRKKYPLWFQPLIDPHEQELGVRFALSQPIVSAIPPADDRFIWSGIEIARRFAPINEAEQKELMALAETVTPFFRKGKITG